MLHYQLDLEPHLRVDSEDLEGSLGALVEVLADLLAVLVVYLAEVVLDLLVVL